MREVLKYTFKRVESCNMCGAGQTMFKVLGKRLNHSQGFIPHKKMGITTTVVRCKNCGLIFSNPQPIPCDIQDHYGAPPESYWNDEYFQMEENYFQEEIKWLKKLISFKPDMRSLDIGAGIGKQMVALQKAGFNAYGLEPGRSFYDRAISKMNISEEKLILSTVENAHYEKEFFDFVSFGAVLEHLYDPSHCIQLALKWLKPGGLIHIEVPNSAWLIGKLLNASYQIRGLDYVTNLSPMHVPYHLYEFGLESFIKNGKKFGYIVKDYTFYVCETFLPSILSPAAKWYMKRRNQGMQLCVWLEKTTV